jgi:outer membrane protein assembly factor BamB
VLVASPQNVTCLALKDGRQKWREELPEKLRGQVRPLLALSGRQAYLVQRDYMQPGRLCSMDLDTRRVAWHRQVERPSDLLARGGVVCLRGQDVVAYDAASGSVLWNRRAGGCSPLTASDGVVHFVDSTGKGRLLGVDLASGRTAWEVDGVRSCDAFIRSKGTGYVKTRGGTLHAFQMDQSHQL